MMSEQESAKSTPPPAPEPEYDEAKLQDLMLELEGRQSLGLGIVGGLVAAVVSAVAWALLTVLTGWQLGIVAVGVGFLVGTGVRIAGKGISKTFGVVGAALALLGCAAGNLFSVCIIIAQQSEVPLGEVLGRLTPAVIAELMKVTFHPMDVVFYAFAAYEGYRLSFRKVTDEELAACLKPSEGGVPPSAPASG